MCVMNHTIPLGHGLTLSVSDDGVWMRFTASSGRECLVKVEERASEKSKTICARTVKEWADDRRKESAEKHGKWPFHDSSDRCEACVQLAELYGGFYEEPGQD